MSTRSQSVARTRTHARTDARPRVRITARAAVFLVMVMLLTVALVYPARLYIEQRGKIADLQRQTDTLIKQNQILSGQVAHLNDPVYLERLARECLGMVKPGETAFVVVPRGGSPKPVAC